MTSVDTSSIWLDLGAVDHRVHRVQVGPWSTRVLVAGEGPPLFLLHGTGGHLEAYARNIEALARTHQVVAYDYPGHGWTTHADEDLELPTYLDHLDGLADALAVGTFDLCGESLGGWIGVKYAATRPDRIRRLVLNTPGGTMASPEVMDRIRTLSQAAADDPSDERIRTRLEWLMADPSAVTDELTAVRKRIYANDGFSNSMRHILCLQDSDIRERNLITDAELSAVSCPTLIVWTSDDPSGPVGAGIEMSNKINDAEFRLIEGAGHWPQWERAGEFNQVVGEFLSA